MLAKQFIYIGPTIDKLGLSKNRIYVCGKKSDLNTMFKKAVEAFPNIMRLFVSVEKLTESEMAMKTKGSPLNLALMEIIKRR